MLNKKLFNILISAMLGIGLLSVSVLADDDPYTTEIRWQKYKTPVAGISVNFPKFPIFIPEVDGCREYKSISYVSYADGVIYDMLVIYRIPKSDVPKYCFEGFKQPWPFERSVLTRRISDYEEGSDTKFEKTKLKNGRQADYLVKGHSKIWLFDDVVNGKIVELSITHRKEKDPDVSRFIETLDLSGEKEGINIGQGSERNLGDQIKPKEVAKSQTSVDEKSGDNHGLFIFKRPRANYSTAARNAMTVGTVRLRVTFLYNGGIGDINVIKGLPNGLTEEAIKAAQKLVFLPRTNDGLMVSTSSVVEYNFNLY